MGPIAAGAIAMSISALLYGGYKLNKRRNRRLLREALRKKYAPDLPPLINTQTSRTVIPEDSSNSDDRPPVRRTKQIEELTESEYDEWQERDEQRDANIMQLRLILEDIISELPELEEENDEDLTEDERIMNLDARAEWIVENEDNFDEHATFVETEMVGSGIIVEEAPPENDDLDQRLKREGGKTGAVQVSLAWDDYNDLDLHLFCPSGERIYFNNKKSDCGGELDVDMNVKPVSNNAVENVVWPKNPPKGTYKVGVHFYKHHKKRRTKKHTKYRLRVSIFGKIQEYSGMIKYGTAIQMVTGFTIGTEDDLSKKYSQFD
tara:strand:+ start:1052 stop:2011 length:960 start_codon:yes stop_codon:yes gene_type:complete